MSRSDLKLHNLTPHPIVVLGERQLELPASTNPARVEFGPDEVVRRKVDGRSVSFCQPTIETVVGLPEPEPGVLFVVSRTLAEAVGRSDLVVPHDLVRSEEGQIVGCRSFACVVDPQTM